MSKPAENTLVIQEIGQENLRMLRGKVQGEKDYEPSSKRPPGDNHQEAMRRCKENINC